MRPYAIAITLLCSTAAAVEVIPTPQPPVGVEEVCRNVETLREKGYIPDYETFVWTKQESYGRYYRIYGYGVPKDKHDNYVFFRFYVATERRQAGTAFLPIGTEAQIREDNAKKEIVAVTHFNGLESGTYYPGDNERAARKIEAAFKKYDDKRAREATSGRRGKTR